MKHGDNAGSPLYDVPTGATAAMEHKDMMSDMRALEVEPPTPGQMTRLADDLWWFRFSLPFRLDHINLYAFDTVDGWLILDCGINKPGNAAQWQTMLNGPLSGRPIVGIIVSHHHADHIGYAGQLARITGAPLYIGQIEHDIAQWALGQSEESFGALSGDAYAAFGLDAETVARTRAVGNYYRSLVGDLPDMHIIAPGHSFVTRSGQWSVRFDAGHSPGHLSLTDAARGLYIGVDFLLPRISPNISVSLRRPDDDVLAQYFTYLDGMTTLPDDWLVISGHDWPYYGGGIRAKQLIDHHEARLQILRDATEPLSTADAMRRLFRFKLTDHEVFFASCEARAHLNHLVTRGLMRRHTEADKTVFLACR